MNPTSVVNLQNATALQGPPPAPSKALGKDEFMKLLMTQLQAQDPLNPTDSTQFVAQLSQFANLEQATNLNTKMDDLIKISGASNSANAVSLLGKEVRVNGNQIGGPTSVFYELASPAQSAKIVVRDAAGKTVQVRSDLETSTGLHEVKLTDFPAGKYTVSVEAADAKGASIESQVSVSDRVRGVNFSDSTPILLTESGSQLKASDIVEIREPGVASAATTTTNSGTTPPVSGLN